MKSFKISDMVWKRDFVEQTDGGADMEKKHEIQKEFWFTLLRKGDLRKLWKPQIEILFMLKGQGRIYYANVKKAYTVREEDIFVINSFEMQNLELEGNAVALSFSASLRFAMAMNPEVLKYRIDCRSFLHAENKQEPFDVLRRDLAKVFEEQYKNVNQTSAHFKSKAAAVLEDLSRYFLDRSKPLENRGSFESLTPAVNYIQSHYRENITLEDLAEQTFLSKTYISRSFSKYFDISFTDYLTLLRVAHASKMLQGRETVSGIALESGFPNVNAMILAFKRHTGMTPGEYRRKADEGSREMVLEEEMRREEVRGDFSPLMKYAKQETQPELSAEKMTEITVDVSGRKQRVSARWKRIINAGYARSVLDGTVQKELRYLQEKIGFEYIRIKGILDDDMCLLRKDMNGQIIVNYAYVDEVLDFILSVGAKPMMELGYVPEVLAGKRMLKSMRNGIVGAPENVDRWRQFIRELVLHIAARYGERQVRRWLFSPWIPPTFIDLGLCGREEWEEIYFASYSAIKEVNENFLTAGPGSTCSGNDYMKWFLEACKKRACIPDMITFRSFASEDETGEKELNLIGNNESFPMAVNGDENLISHMADGIRKTLGEMNLSDLPVILEEWSNNIWQRDLCNDTCYKSAYLFKNILENNQNLSGMGYFTLNDRMDEVPPASDTFHGGFGLFTQNDIPKSACRAMELLNEMGDRLIQRGDGYYITRTEDEIQVFLYHYSHYDLLYRYRHVMNMSRTERYDVFISKDPRAFYINFEKLDAGEYEIRRYRITRDGGSSYDAWVKMGAPEPLEAEETELLRNLSKPLYKRWRVQVDEEGSLGIRESLMPQDVCLLKIKIL